MRCFGRYLSTAMRSVVWSLLLGLLTTATSLQASTERIWSGPPMGDWFEASHWSGSGDYPQAGDTVVVNSGSVLVTNATAALLSFSLGTEATLVFSNWTAQLEAETVVLAGEVTLPAAFTDVQMSNRVHFVGTDFTLHQSGLIDVDGRGFANNHGSGKGASTDGWGGGAGHGGRGGHAGYDGGGRRTAGGPVYGTLHAPLTPGSGGGDGNSTGGSGGGVVRIAMSGTVTINGIISASGTDGVNLGGGAAGGSVYITAGTFGGSTNGFIRADGGNGNFHSTAPQHTGGGGGGRIAVDYTSISPDPGVRFSARRADRSFLMLDEYHPDPKDRLPPESGTLHFSDTALLDGVIATWNQSAIAMAGSIHFDATDQWTLAANVWSNSQLTVPAGATWTTAGDLTISTGLVSVAAGAEFTVAGDLTLTNGATMSVYAAPTNGSSAYGNLVEVDGTLTIAPDTWVYPYSDSANGGSVRFLVGALHVASGGGFNADGRGFARNTGEGKGTQNSGFGGGGGYGGQGGRGVWPTGFAERGSAYGDPYAPLDPGSGGGHSDSFFRGGAGGGVIWVESAGSLHVDGTLSANGEHALRLDGGNTPAGGGSGGGIFLAGSSFSGGGGAVIRANGGDGGYWQYDRGGGGGGGGRISIVTGLDSQQIEDLKAGVSVQGLVEVPGTPQYNGSVAANAGNDHSANTDPDYQAKPGTKTYLSAVAEDTFSLLISGTPSAKGSPQPKGYGFHADLLEDTVVTNTVASPADITATQQWVLIDWQLRDDQGGVYAPGSGTSTQVVFTVTTNLHLTWNWTNQFYLNTSAGANGSVSPSGWHTQGDVVEISATADPAFVFTQWSGDVPTGQIFENPTLLTMDQARSVAANFAADTGVAKTWTGGVGSWTEPFQWDPEGIPGPFDMVTIPEGTVILSNPQVAGTVSLAEHATLVFSNWTTRLEADTFSISGEVTLPAAFTDAQMSNRVHFVGTDFTLHQSGTIDVDGRGFANANGPGAGLTGSGWGSGAGFGGRGGHAVFTAAGGGAVAGGTPYGDVSAPVAPGSGGGDGNSTGGSGGGVVRIAMSGAVTIDGTISASGTDGVNLGGGGSGGSIYITADSFGGSTNGFIRADAGSYGAASTQQYPGGGGGGRIAIDYTTLAGSPGVRLSARRAERSARQVDDFYLGPASRKGLAPGIGTIHLPGTDLLDATLSVWDQAAVAWAGTYHFASTQQWTLASTLWDNSQFAVPAGNEWILSDSLTVLGGALLVESNASFKTVGNLAFTNGVLVSVYAAETNGMGALYGQHLLVGGNLTLDGESWIYPFAHSDNGGTVRFEVGGDLWVGSGSGFNADGRGYARMRGPGKGALDSANVASGAGYGGRGGDSLLSGHTVAGGEPYSSPYLPIEPGSGGGHFQQTVHPFQSWPGRAGGGTVWLDVSGKVDLKGTLTANGFPGSPNHGGGGSGGSILLAGRRINVEPGAILQANGGAAGGDNSGAGGGGRIAVWQSVDQARRLASSEQPVAGVTVTSEWPLGMNGTVTVDPGSGGAYFIGHAQAASEGSLRYLVGSQGSLFMIR